jgi:hypothetical protein
VDQHVQDAQAARAAATEVVLDARAADGVISFTQVEVEEEVADEGDGINDMSDEAQPTPPHRARSTRAPQGGVLTRVDFNFSMASRAGAGAESLGSDYHPEKGPHSGRAPDGGDDASAGMLGAGVGAGAGAGAVEAPLRAKSTRAPGGGVLTRVVLGGGPRRLGSDYKPASKGKGGGGSGTDDAGESGSAGTGAGANRVSKLYAYCEACQQLYHGLFQDEDESKQPPPTTMCPKCVALMNLTAPVQSMQQSESARHSTSSQETDDYVEANDMYQRLSQIDVPQDC